MKTRAVWIAGFAFAVALFLGAGAEAQQLPKSGKYTGKYLNSATVYKLIELEKDHSFVQELVEGVFLNDLGEGFLHGAGTTCPVIGEVTTPALVPLTFHAEDAARFSPLAGVSLEVEASADAEVREIRDQWVFLGALAAALLVGAGMLIWRGVSRPRGTQGPRGCSANGVTP